MILGDTIAAVSTPRGKGGVALLRVSGEKALEICQRVFFPKNQKKLGECQPRTAVYGNIYAPDAKGEWNAIDDGIATFFPCPASFTGEDTVEICCHGGALLTQKVLTALLSSVKTMNNNQLTKLVNNILPMLTTDMTNSDITNCMVQILPILSELEISTQSIPAAGTYKSCSIRGMAVLVPDLEANRAILRETLQ